MPWKPFHLRLPYWLRVDKSYQKLEESENVKTGLFSSTNTPFRHQDPEVSQILSHLSSYPHAQVANQRSFNRNTLQTATYYNRQRAMADQNRESAAPVARQPTPESSSNPRGDAHTPYTISSGEWCPTWNTAGDNLHVHHVPEKQMKTRWESVLSVASIVYGIAKVFLTICRNFGVELDNSPTGILFHIEQVEAEMVSDNIVTLIFAIEDLYYVLYARLAIEIGNVQLCSSFNLDIRGLSGKDAVVLPEPRHLLAILNICKEVLDARQVCQVLNEEILKRHQEEFVQQAIKEYSDMGRQPDDMFGYRRHIRELVNDPTSRFSQQWRGLNPVYQMAPKEILAILSEKYLSATSPEKRADNAVALELPFVDPNTVDPDVWERRTVRAHRQATLAILEGKSVGEVRREADEGFNAMDYVKEQKCVCFGFCSCAEECTRDAERLCPCAERVMRALVVEQAGQNFGQQGSLLAEVVFEGLSAVRRDASKYDMARELTPGLDLFKNEVVKLREARTG